MYWVGVDIGSLTVKVVALGADGQKRISEVAPAGRSGVDTAMTLIGRIPSGQVRAIVATGYGRVAFPRADLEVSEITCHALGALHLYPDARTVIDVGGQDCKAIQLDADGRVQQFAMNERCAAGTGRFLEVMARALEVAVEELAEVAAQAANRVVVSSTCTVFAESEVVGHLNSGVSPGDVASGLMDAIAGRIVGMPRQVPIEPRVVMAGGVACNQAVVERVEQGLQLEVAVPDEPQVVGALGAALVSRRRFGTGGHFA